MNCGIENVGVKDRAPRQRCLSAEVKRPIFISRTRVKEKKGDRTGSLFNKPQKRVNICADHYLLRPKSFSSIQILSPKPFDLYSKSLLSELKSSDSLIASCKLLEKSKEIHSTCSDLLNQTLEHLKHEQNKYKSVPFSKPLGHSKATDFFLSVKNNDTQSVVRLLRSFPSLVNVVDSTQKNALHWAGQRGSVEMVENLLQAGVDWKHQDLLGRDPMTLAGQSRNTEAYQMFFTKKKQSILWSKKMSVKNVLRFSAAVKSRSSKPT